FQDTFHRAVQESDAVWPIAPEQDGILAHITKDVISSGRTVLNSRVDAIEIAASKRATAEALGSAGIPVVPVWPEEASIPAGADQIVVKPDDGAGCQETLLFYGRAELREWLREGKTPKQIFQPLVHGEARSLSTLCCEGRSRLLACNRQHVEVIDGVFHFSGVSVNAIADRQGSYAALAASIARALPGLWGYCGIDFIETSDGPLVIEVNPRLTTSYAGLRRAIAINSAQLVLGLPTSLDAPWSHEREAHTIEVEVAHAG
ncbi:MAG: ATP-grasp domain-containing protein, partial [Burkholderiales bacterium]